VLLHLVRHGRPTIEPGKLASSWQLDPAASPGLQRLRSFMVANAPAASWHSSDEPKAVATASALTDGEVEVVPMLREAGRADWFPLQDQFRAAVLAAFSEPTIAACPGWEPFDQTRARVRVSADEIVGRSPNDVVLVGHGTAWTLLVSDITGQPPDLESWARLGLPDLCTLDLHTESVVRAWGTWQSHGSAAHRPTVVRSTPRPTATGGQVWSRTDRP
jgi:broad specificity phosphatase PhoE